MGILRALRKLNFIWLMATLGVLFLWPSSSVTASPVRLQEQKIKAGLLYNFIKYTYWPERVFNQADEPFQICLYGGDPFEGNLDPVQGRTAQMRAININKINRIDLIYDCHLVFIHRDQEHNAAAMLDAVEGHSIMTVSDIEDFSAKGGMVEFSKPQEKRIHLYLNKDAIEKAGLRVGEELLELAEAK